MMNEILRDKYGRATSCFIKIIQTLPGLSLLYYLIFIRLIIYIFHGVILKINKVIG